jgi:dipeptidyl-peptidase-3
VYIGMKTCMTLTLDKLKEHIYALTPESNLFIGKRSLGHISNYYLGEPISDEEVASVQTAAEALGIDILNTRYEHRLYLSHSANFVY